MGKKVGVKSFLKLKLQSSKGVYNVIPSKTSLIDI